MEKKQDKKTYSMAGNGRFSLLPSLILPILRIEHEEPFDEMADRHSQEREMTGLDELRA